MSVGVVRRNTPENSWGWGCVDFQRQSSVFRPLFSWGSLCLSHTADLCMSSDLAPPWIEWYSEPVKYKKTQSQNSVMHQGMFFEGTTVWRLQFVVVQISLPTYSDLPPSTLPTSTDWATGAWLLISSTHTQLAPINSYILPEATCTHKKRKIHTTSSWLHLRESNRIWIVCWYSPHVFADVHEGPCLMSWSA